MDLELPTFSQADSKKYVISKRQAAPTICQVCMGKATGHHYDVASCNGCKSFFRRVTIEKLSYTCKFNNECFDELKIGDTVPKCRSCRFNKCVLVGMNPLGIQSELKREIKMECLPIVEKPWQTVESQIGEIISKLLRLDAQSEEFRDCSFSPQTFPTLKELVKQDKSILSLAHKFQPLQALPFQESNFEDHFKPRKIDNSNRTILKRWIVYELLIQVEIAKALPFFADLSESDRYHLTQDTVLMSTHLTRAFYSFEQKSDKLIRPDGVEYFARGFPLLDEFQSRFRDDIGMRCLSVILRNGLDRVEFVLLRVLVLINPSIPELSEHGRKFLTKERQKYNIALFRYIMAKDGASGPGRFANILGFIDVLEHQQRDHRDLSMLMNLRVKDRRIIPILDDIMKF